MDWRQALIRNWPYKIAAITLSVLLWFTVSAGDERSEQAVATRLDLQVTDPGWVAVQPPTEVLVTFQGRRSDLFALFNQPTIRRIVADVGDSTVQIELSTNDVVYPQDLNVRPVSIRPSLIVLQLEPVISMVVPVSPDVTAAAADGFLSQPAVVRPESVTVRGAASEVTSISELRTEPVRLDALRAAVTRQLELRLPDGAASLSVEPSQVVMTVEVDSVVARRLQLPVTIEAADGGRVTSRPRSVTVTLRGASAVVRPIDAADVSAVVVLDSPLDGPRVVEVRVRIPADLSLVTATVEPRTVTVEPATS